MDFIIRHLNSLCNNQRIELYPQKIMKDRTHCNTVDATQSVRKVLEKRKIATLVVIALTILSIGLMKSTAKQDTQKAKAVAVGTFDLQDIQNPENWNRLEHKGYIIIKPESRLPDVITVKRGQEIQVDFIVKFVSFDEQEKTAMIDIAPKADVGLKVERVMEDGSIVALNDYITYSVSSSSRLESNKELVVTATILFPETLKPFKIPLNAVGIDSVYPFVDKTEVWIDVQ